MTNGESILLSYNQQREKLMIKVWKEDKKKLYLALRDACEIEDNPSIVAVGSDGLFVAYLFYLSEEGKWYPNKYTYERSLLEDGYNTDDLLWDEEGGFAGIKPVKKATKDLDAAVKRTMQPPPKETEEESFDMARVDNKEME